MAVTAAKIKELRDASGAGMMDCKKALEETNGNMEEAVVFLREQGLSQAAKRSERTAGEGIVHTEIAEDGSAGIVVEVNSETDFVAKNEQFQEFVKNVGAQLLKSGETELDAFLALDADFYDGTIEEALTNQIAVIGENLLISRIGRLEKADDTKLFTYVHGEGQIGVLVEAKSDSFDEAKDEAAHNVCLQIAAMLPKYLKVDDIDEDFVEAEKEIITARFENDGTLEGKPENIQEQIVKGALNKNLGEMCLLTQDYVKESGMKVEKYVKGEGIEIVDFISFERGAASKNESEEA